ncbi:type VI secretion system contractile sheath large subunit [Acidocella sp.]|uniref:type VI secretion system contractile sheath large subunit n=1 Tax=Acidocella sp. TaxID=50710 RepID=UPI00262D828E|nr:type VI secretion system contractile sheath large subunit [Acidocella sp.]
MAGDEDDPDATIVWRPNRVLPQFPAPGLQPGLASRAEAAEPIQPSPPPEPEPASPPLRDAVLAGAFFGAAHAQTAASLAEMLAGQSPAISAWFGTDANTLIHDRPTLAARLDRDIARLDAMIARQLDEILHHPRLRRLEGSWRGLAWLVARLPLSGRVKLRVLNLSWAELCRDFERAAEFDQSQLFRRIYEDEFGIAGGEPYGLLVADYEVRHRPGPGAITDDVTALSSLAAVAAAAFAPLVIGASPALFGVDEFSELSGVADPASSMAAAEYQRWKRLGALEDSRFLAVTLPRLLMRLPWVETLSRHRGFRYREQMQDGTSRVTTTAGYLVAACVIRAFDTYSWPADIRGYDIDRLGGGIIEDLPEPRFSTDPPDGFGRPAPDVMLTDKQERALVAAGLLPICALPYGGEALIGAARSLQTPATNFIGANAAMAAANARLSAQFNSVICVSRFAHYVKIMGRDMTGAFKTAPEVQRRLYDWLMRYTNANTSAGPETMARYPLRDASVQVEEVPGKPGVFTCAIHLQPHFQLDDVAVSFRLMTELSSPGQQ